MNTPAPANLADRWSETLAALQPASGPAWLRALRQTAANHFRSSGLPHRKVEAWKYTPLKALESLALETASNDRKPRVDLPPPLREGTAVVDFIDGMLAVTPSVLPSGVTLLPLVEGIARFEGRVKPLFESVELGGATSAFNALNTACANQGLVLHVAAGVDAGTLAIRWAFSSNHSEVIRNPRLVILLDEGARLDLLEQYQSEVDVTAGLNVLALAELGAGSRLRHTLVQAESERAVVLTSIKVHQAEDSSYSYHGFDLGADLARHEITVLLLGTGARADIAGAFVLGGRRHADHHVSIEHRAPACRSEQFFRGVLGGRSRGVFNGRALIQPGADGSSVRQSNANLLLSPLAEIDTKPELEIYADEVEASHGATVGQLDEAAVFYLRSRGLSETDARRLLTTAFCHAVSDRLEDRALAGRITSLLDAAMPTDTDV
jgi:Fe-S cluster assembly protein SufD